MGEQMDANLERVQPRIQPGGDAHWQCRNCLTVYTSLRKAEACKCEPVKASTKDEQHGGSHYRDMQIQPWEAMAAWMTDDQRVGYHLGDALAYLARFNVQAEGKGGLTDIRKAIHHLQAACEVLERAAKEGK